MKSDLEMNDQQIKHMVDRFLSWKLPADFAPDGGIAFDPIIHLGTEHQSRREPVGTNLFTATQAEEMVRHMVAEMAAGNLGEDDYRAFCDDDPDHRADGTIESLVLVAKMLETYGPECFPANEQGQVHFARAIMDSAAAEIRAFLSHHQVQSDEE